MTLVERLRDLSDEDACETFVPDGVGQRRHACTICGYLDSEHTLNEAANTLEAIEAEVVRWREEASSTKRRLVELHAATLQECADAIDTILHPKEKP